MNDAISPVEMGELAEEPGSNGDSDRRYANKVSAPLSPEVIAALRARLESEECAQYRRLKHREPKAEQQ